MRANLLDHGNAGHHSYRLGQPSTPNLQIGFAGPELSPAVATIWYQALAWLSAKGLRGWSAQELQAIDLPALCSAGEVVLGFQTDMAVACMLLQREDPVYWPEATPGSALYIHKLAVDRVVASTGWSSRMIEWAKEQARMRGISRLRLDTLLDSPLPALYIRHRFQIVDHVTIRGRALCRMEWTAHPRPRPRSRMNRT